MTCESTQWVDALELGAQGDAREAEVVHALGLTRTQSARHPNEATASVGERLAQLCFLEAGKGGNKLFDHLVAILNRERVGVERIDGNIAGKQPPVAIDDIGARPAARQ